MARKGVQDIEPHIVEIIRDMNQNGPQLDKVTQHLDRKDYVKLNDALTALGGKWKGGKVQAHVFACTPEELTQKISNLTATGQYVNTKKEFEFFETPPELAERLVELAEVHVSHNILEPSAGQGAIVKAIRHLVGELPSITMVEPLDENLKSLNALRDKGCGSVHSMTFEDYCTALKKRDYMLLDRVIMNPPFQFAIEHVKLAWDLLNSKGRLVAVMPAGIEFREDKKHIEFRNFVEENGYMESIEQGTFKSSGTMVNTTLIVLDK